MKFVLLLDKSNGRPMFINFERVTRFAAAGSKGHGTIIDTDERTFVVAEEIEQICEALGYDYEYRVSMKDRGE